jgi:hypothetical protein
MYFVHQRGLRIAVVNFVLNAASSLASIICGEVFADLGWLWLFQMFQIFFVFPFVAMFLFYPEQHTFETVAISNIRRKTFVQELAIFTGVYSDDNMLKYLLGPFITLLNPAACYAVVTSGLLNSWYVGSAIILSGIFSGPPCNFGPAQIGYLGADPFIGDA